MANDTWDYYKSGALGGTIVPGDTWEMGLLKSTHTFTESVRYNSDANGPQLDEAVMSGYTGGWGNSGRHILASGAVTTDTTNHRAELDFTDPAVWSAIGDPTSDTIICWAYKSVTSDAASTCCVFIDTSTGTPSFPYTANGSDLTIQLNANGLVWLT